MAEMVAEAEVRAWEAQQHLGFALIDGRPVRLPDADHGPSRVARVPRGRWSTVRRRCLDPQPTGGLEPEALAAHSEEGCQIVLRALVALGRHQEAAGG